MTQTRALVTGASRGIGAATAERLAAQGADVALLARPTEASKDRPGDLNEVAERVAKHGGRVTTVECDLADPAARADAVERAAAGLGGPITVLVNNAAGNPGHALAEYSLADARWIFELNVFAPLDLAQQAIPAMRDAASGWVVNISSGTAQHIAGPPFRRTALTAGLGLYGASKAAIDRLTNALAVELHGTGIRVNGVQPRAAVLTEGMNDTTRDNIPTDMFEPMDAMTSAIAALCSCEEERTGRTYVSLDLLAELGISVPA